MATKRKKPSQTNKPAPLKRARLGPALVAAVLKEEAPPELDAALKQAAALKTAWIIAAVFVLARLWFIGRISLAPDEAYYWDWSRHPDWSYYDQGPMLAWVIRAGTALLGQNEWGVRLGALVAGFGISACYIFFARRMNRPLAAPWLVLAGNSMLLFSVGGVLMIHDSLAAFYWTLGLAGALKAIEDDERWWLACGLAGGAAVLSKYTAVLLLPCLALACAAHPGLRHHLRRPWFWLAALMGGILAGLPILRWNSQHGWPSLLHVASLGGGDASRISLASFPEFAASQFALVTPVLMVLVLAAWAWAWRLRQEEDRAGRLRWLLAACSAPVLALFVLLSLHSRVEGNWPTPAYLGALPLVAWQLAQEKRLGSKTARWALGVALALTLAVFTQAAWGWLPLPAARAPRLDATFRLQGWQELAARVAQEQAALPGPSFVGCRTYQNTAELSFYLPGQVQPLVLQAGQINHQYRFWNQPQAHLGQDAILVISQGWELDEMKPMFESIQPLPDEVALRRDVVMRRSLLFVGHHFKGLP